LFLRHFFSKRNRKQALKSESWENSKKLWKHSLRIMFPQQFSFFQTFTHVSITQWKHGTCFLFLKYVTLWSHYYYLATSLFMKYSTTTSNHMLRLWWMLDMLMNFEPIRMFHLLKKTDNYFQRHVSACLCHLQFNSE